MTPFGSRWRLVILFRRGREAAIIVSEQSAHHQKTQGNSTNRDDSGLQDLRIINARLRSSDVAWPKSWLSPGEGGYDCRQSASRFFVRRRCCPTLRLRLAGDAPNELKFWLGGPIAAVPAAAAASGPVSVVPAPQVSASKPRHAIDAVSTHRTVGV